MKTFISILTFMTIFSGCSSHNAFDVFHISKKQALTEDSIQSSKIKIDDKIDGLITVMYLNNILPNTYKDGEYFYLYFYKKSSIALSFKLNGKELLNMRELQSSNRFSKLTSFQAQWQKYYLVKFKEEGATLNFTIDNQHLSADTLKFYKNL